MFHVEEVIIVEGKYDKNRLSSIIDGDIIELNGFSIFNDKEKQNLILRLAEKRGIIVLTDSDGAGFVLRKKIKEFVPKEYIKHAYIPDVFGKEKRKSTESKEGKLGVEGMTTEILIHSLRNCGAGIKNKSEIRKITKSDFYRKGLTGKKDSSKIRANYLEYFNLPERMTANQLFEVLNILITPEEFDELNL